MKIMSLPLPKVLLFTGLLVGLLICALLVSRIMSEPDESPSSISLQSQSDSCIDNSKQRLRDGNKIQLYKCNGKESQQWSLHSDGSLRIQDYCIQIPNNSKKPKTLLELHKCNGSKGQVWEVNKNGTITNPNSNLCLEPKNGETANGVALWVNKCNGSSAQKWSPPSEQSPKAGQNSTSTDKKTANADKDSSSSRKDSKKTNKKPTSTDKKTTKKTQKSTSLTKKVAKNTTQKPTTPSTTPPKNSDTSPTPSPKPPSSEQPPAPSPAKWSPKVGQTWQYQLMNTVDLSVKAAVYNIDGFDTPASKINAIHNQGSYAICYISAGSWEDWRPDANQFPSSVKGKNLDGWPGEKWLDTRNINALAPIMSSRMDMCVNKGFDGVEFDNVDGHIQNSGFNITDSQQLNYNKWLASTARSKGLKVGLKNNLDQVSRLASHYDFAVNEECFAWNECGDLMPFINAGKPVFHVEYDYTTNQFCPTTKQLGFSSIKKSLDLKAPLTRC